MQCSQTARFATSEVQDGYFARLADAQASTYGSIPKKFLCLLACSVTLSFGCLFISLHPAYASTLSALPGEHHVLLVIDMQKDYDRIGNQELYGEIRSPYVGELTSIVPNINALRRSRRWDKVIFTKDWLSAEAITKEGRRPFCVANTPGTDLLEGLVVNANTDLFFTKSVDDAFNLNQNALFSPRSSSSADPPHGYGLRDEGVRIGAASNALVDILRHMGYLPHDTTLVIAGQMTDRCVMKTALHAHTFGYDVVLERSAVYTSDDKPDAAWPWKAPVLRVSEVEIEDVYSSPHAPGGQLAIAFMKAAGIRVA